jgi:hypothetical protein
MSVVLIMVLSLAYLALGTLVGAVRRAYFTGSDAAANAAVVLWPLWLALGIIMFPFAVAFSLSEWLAEKLPR